MSFGELSSNFGNVLGSVRDGAGQIGDMLRSINGKPSAKASFDGVSFYVIGEASSEGGRRLVVHEFPFKNQHGVDDLGQKVGSVSIKALFLGRSYMSDYAKFEAVLIKDGAGELVHPWIKRGKYYIESYKGYIDASIHRAAYFDLTLTPAGEEISPTASENTAASLATSINDAINTVMDGFNTVFAVIDDVSTTIDAVTGVIDQINYGVNLLSSSVRDGFGLVGSINKLKSSVNTLIKSPKMLSSALSSVIIGIGSNTTPDHAHQIYSQMLLRSQTTDINTKLKRDNVPLIDQNGTVNVALTGITPNSLSPQTVQNMAALDVMCKGITLCCLIYAISNSVDDALSVTRIPKSKPKTPKLMAFDKPWEIVDADDPDTVLIPVARPPIVTKKDALAVIENTGIQLDELINRLANSDWDYLSSMHLKHQFLIDAHARTQVLVGSNTITPKITLPSLDLLYQTKQNAMDNAGFVARNGIRNPLFVAVNIPVEVLND